MTLEELKFPVFVVDSEKGHAAICRTAIGMTQQSMPWIQSRMWVNALIIDSSGESRRIVASRRAKRWPPAFLEILIKGYVEVDYVLSKDSIDVSAADLENMLLAIAYKRGGFNERSPEYWKEHFARASTVADIIKIVLEVDDQIYRR